MQYATRCFMGSLFLLSSLSLWASQSQNLPAEIYQEIVANADTLADSAAVFSKLSQTSKALKQQLDAALPAIVEQLARKYGVDTDVASLYFGIDQAKKLNPALFKNTDKLSKLLEEIAAKERDPVVLQKRVAALTKEGAHFTKYYGRIIDGKYMKVYMEDVVLIDQNDGKVEEIQAFYDSQLYDFIVDLGGIGRFQDVNELKINNNRVLRFLISTIEDFDSYIFYIVDTDSNFNIISTKELILPKSFDLKNNTQVCLVTSRDGAHSSIIFYYENTINVVSLDDQQGTMTAAIKRSENNLKYTKYPWQK